ncbi:polysaccharide deacetylase family protein [Aureibaculum sp. A20]|uniref:Polysaccharide deacetylase family protein n=1 Tax=Aureibaculum flavum TaxID=2795986 RepID=A0ABS0WSU7_9FLAO|nr:polysaccharide deacetylase family protein [Aureibaculum flavum]MBJ2175024.1 polysaccharide deacetylase family protein [Aureibaculum flavum]
MLLVYTNKITPRLTYTFKHFFTRILKIQVDFTSKVEDFIAHEGYKLSYGKQPFGNEIFIRSTDLLFEQGINDIEIKMGEWNGVQCFFQTRQEASVPFDIFAATFYLVSRYEEYLPHLRDEHERYPAEDSLAFKHQFLHKPLIDIWAYKFKEILKEKYPSGKLKKREFKFISTIDVDIAYCFKHKGLVRTVAGYFRDLSKLRLFDLWYRSLVILGFKQDPFDTFDDLISLQKQYNIKTIFFFSVGGYTTFDKNTSSRNVSYQSLIKSVADYAEVGLHPSYFTSKDESKLQSEKLRLESIVNRPIEKSRQHYLRLDLPETYQNLVNLEVKEDYTMGYASHFGFRASTCTPFYFYDLEFEIQTPLKVFPFAVMDGTLKDYLKLPNKQSFEVIIDLANQVKKVDGTFITLFHNETLGNRYRWRRWRKIYIDMFKKLTPTA